MQFKIANLGFDSHQVASGKEIHAKTIEIKGWKQHFTCPAVVMNHVELGYAGVSAATRMGMPVIEMVRNFGSTNQLDDPILFSQEVSAYSRNISHPFISGWAFQRTKTLALKDKHLDKVAEIQYAAGSRELSHVEKLSHQPVSEMANEINRLQNDYPDCDICPTLDIGMVGTRLLRDKLKKIIDMGISKVNVQYRSIAGNMGNWLDLSSVVFDKDIWVNCVGIVPRINRWTKDAYLPQVFMFGVDTASAGIMPFPRGKPTPILMDARTLKFNDVPTMTYEQSRTQTIVEQGKALSDFQKHIKDKTFFSQLAPAKNSLNKILSSIR